MALLPLLFVSLAGCLDAKPLEAADSRAHLHDHVDPAVDPALRIEAKDCVQGGGNSVYAGTSKIGPFDSADQKPEVGNPTIGAFGAPLTGPAYGIWHVGTMCKSYTYLGKEYPGFQMGWIAQMIQKPSFDTGDQRITFMVADLSFNNPDFVAATGNATHGAEISPSTAMAVDLYPAQKLLHVTISESHHGTFDFNAEIHKEFAKKETEHIRFWMLPRVDGQAHVHGADAAPGAPDPVLYRPIAIDVYDTARGGVKIAGESVGTFTHIQDLNKPSENHFGNPLGHYWNGFDRTIVIGPMPDNVTFDQTWLH